MRHFFARREHSRLHQFAFLAAGGLAGAGVALLLAPRTGREARKSLAHMGKFARDGARNFRSELNSSMDRFFWRHTARSEDLPERWKIVDRG